MRRDRRLSEVVEPAFEVLDVDDRTWLGNIITALEQQAGDGLGCAATFYRSEETAFGFHGVVHRGLPSGLDPHATFDATRLSGLEYNRHFYANVAATTTRELGPECERGISPFLFDWGVRDSVCINARAPRLRGAGLLLHRRRRRQLGRGERAWFAELAALLSIALRTRLELRARAHPLARLSNRERAVVLALGPDVLNKEIGAAFGISASSVGVLLHRAAAKLGVRSRHELMAIVQRAPVYPDGD